MKFWILSCSLMALVSTTSQAATCKSDDGTTGFEIKVLSNDVINGKPSVQLTGNGDEVRIYTYSGHRAFGLLSYTDDSAHDLLRTVYVADDFTKVTIKDGSNDEGGPGLEELNCQ